MSRDGHSVVLISRQRHSGVCGVQAAPSQTTTYPTSTSTPHRQLHTLHRQQVISPFTSKWAVSSAAAGAARAACRPAATPCRARRRPSAPCPTRARRPGRHDKDSMNRVKNGATLHKHTKHMRTAGATCWTRTARSSRCGKVGGKAAMTTGPRMEACGSARGEGRLYMYVCVRRA